mmetsp:Transcript_28209/g.59834  ORF Transcript_28209/g.59834 Transcript_28209/m.59834 type:complete len:122 (-) Transcript_28209:118-483(-)
MSWNLCNHGQGQSSDCNNCLLTLNFISNILHMRRHLPVGALFSLYFSVDLTHVSLAEHDAQLELFLEDRLDKYKGRLNAKKHLSLFERLFGRHGEYDQKWAFELVKKNMERALIERSLSES